MTEESTHPPSEEANKAAETEKPVTLGRKLLSWGVQLAVFLALFLGVQMWINRTLLPSGTKAPEFRLKTLAGKTVSLSQYKGKRVILHFWATWCSACKTNLHTHKLVQKSYQKDPVLLSVLADPKNQTALKRIVKKHGLTYPILFATPQVIRQYRVNRFPTTYFINHKGQIASQDSGIITPIGLWWRSAWTRLRSL